MVLEIIMETEPSYEIRTEKVCDNVEMVGLLDFIQDEFIVSRQTAKKMLNPDTLLVYHLSKAEAEEHLVRFKLKGLICKMVIMEE